MSPVPSIERFALLVGLAFFFGLAFEELYAQSASPRPGGIRTFPLLALIGALLYLLDPSRVLPFSAGFLVLGILLAISYRRHMDEKDAEGRSNVTLAPALCNLLAYILGPVALAAPPWIPVGVTVTAVLLLAERERLHRFASGIPTAEIITAGQFLILTGLVLPLLPRQPITKLTTVTPQQVWLAVVAVCTLSYASYLLQRYVVPRSSSLWLAVLGGLYSSTATTVALARAAREDSTLSRDVNTGIVLATAVMYLRLLVVILVFNVALAQRLAPFLMGLFALGIACAPLAYMVGGSHLGGPRNQSPPRNPLELGAAFLFAALFVIMSLASSWVLGTFGISGVFWLAAIVGFTDIDPFVLSLAQGAATPLPLHASTAAILIAASSNNILKLGYATGFAGWRTTLTAGVALAVLAVVGVLCVLVI